MKKSSGHVSDLRLGPKSGFESCFSDVDENNVQFITIDTLLPLRFTQIIESDNNFEFLNVGC